MELMLLLGVLAVVVVVLAVWMSQQILRPAEQLDASRRELKQMYEAARADSLHDALTGLGNHRAFQEELAGRSSGTSATTCRSRCCSSTSTSSRSSTTRRATPPATSSSSAWAT